MSPFSPFRGVPALAGKRKGSKSANKKNPADWREKGERQHIGDSQLDHVKSKVIILTYVHSTSCSSDTFRVRQ